MTDAKNQQAEPSMEEILASIRRIISEDGDAGKNPPAPTATPVAAASATVVPPPASSAPAPQPPEILELTEMVGDDGNVTDLVEAKPATPTPEPVPAPAVMPAPAPAPAAEEGELVSQQTAAAAIGALAGLAAATRNRESDSPRGGLFIGNGSATLEEMVRAEMRPMLKAWLDEQLPGLVERLVQKEIKRITRQVDET